jgi:hypothetical protein
MPAALHLREALLQSRQGVWRRPACDFDGVGGDVERPYVYPRKDPAPRVMPIFTLSANEMPIVISSTISRESGNH